jgi:alkanesulfonate monooxygenase SsuD/methylene tetrahydromethanopterin reductase-like flavin-dependent oxidoreductase (luciferase family)
VRERALFELYAEVSKRPLGDGLGVLRDVVVADTDAEAQALWRDSGAFVGAAWFAPFGFDQGMANPETGAPPDLMEDSLVLVGSPDTVSRQLERLLKRLPAKWLFAWTYNGLIPHAKLMRSIERFATEVLPRFGGMA